MPSFSCPGGVISQTSAPSSEGWLSSSLGECDQVWGLGPGPVTHQMLGAAPLTSRHITRDAWQRDNVRIVSHSEYQVPILTPTRGNHCNDSHCLNVCLSPWRCSHLGWGWLVLVTLYSVLRPDGPGDWGVTCTARGNPPINKCFLPCSAWSGRLRGEWCEAFQICCKIVRLASAQTWKYPAKYFIYLQHTHMCSVWIRALPPVPICMVMCPNEGWIVRYCAS